VCTSGLSLSSGETPSRVRCVEPQRHEVGRRVCPGAGPTYLQTQSSAAFRRHRSVTVLVLRAGRGDERPAPVGPDTTGPLRPSVPVAAARAALDHLKVIDHRPEPSDYERG